jgi:hypothetical protein
MLKIRFSKNWIANILKLSVLTKFIGSKRAFPASKLQFNDREAQ